MSPGSAHSGVTIPFASINNESDISKSMISKAGDKFGIFLFLPYRTITLLYSLTISSDNTI